MRRLHQPEVRELLDQLEAQRVHEETERKRREYLEALEAERAHEAKKKTGNAEVYFEGSDYPLLMPPFMSELFKTRPGDFSIGQEFLPVEEEHPLAVKERRDKEREEMLQQLYKRRGKR